MRAISLHQPWVELIAIGLKRHETRSWRYPKHMEDQRILFHAAKRPMRRAEISPELLPYLDDRADMAYGAFILTARLAGCFQTECREPYSAHDRMAGDWSFGRYAWALADIEVLPAPIPAVGRQGWWEVPDLILKGEKT